MMSVVYRQAYNAPVLCVDSERIAAFPVKSFLLQATIPRRSDHEDDDGYHLLAIRNLLYLDP